MNYANKLTEQMIRKAVKDHGLKVVKGDLGYTIQPQGRYVNEIYNLLEVDNRFIAINRLGYEYGDVVKISYLAGKNAYINVQLHDGSFTDWRLTRTAAHFIPLQWLFPKKNHLPKWF